MVPIKTVLITEEELQKKIKEMGAQISKDYEGKDLYLIGILKGSCYFLCDLSRAITIPVYLDFMSVSSYGNATVSSGVVKINKDLDDPVEGKDVLIVEDIVDTGRTLSYLKELILGRNAKSVKIATLLDKPSRRVVDLVPDYKGFTIPDEFVVGMGMDCAQEARNLPYIGVVDRG